MVLQYRKVGRWRDYLYGERAYMLFSLIAKSLLAWQVFFGRCGRRPARPHEPPPPCMRDAAGAARGLPLGPRASALPCLPDREHACPMQTDDVIDLARQLISIDSVNPALRPGRRRRA